MGQRDLDIGIHSLHVCASEAVSIRWFHARGAGAFTRGWSGIGEFGSSVENQLGRSPPSSHDLCMNDWSTLDRQMHTWGSRLRDDLDISAPDAARLASTIARELDGAAPATRTAIRAASSVPLESRLDEIRAFQMWMDLSAADQSNPIARAKAKPVSSFDRLSPTGAMTARTGITISEP